MKVRGFTLWELLIVLLLLVVMLLMASPAWRTLLSHNQIDAILEPLVGDIRFSRRSAIAAGENVSLCGSADQDSCDGAWSAGRIVLSQSGKILRRSGKLPAGYRIVWRSNLSRNDRLEFVPDGFTNGQQGSFYICSPQSSVQEGKIIVLAYTGRLRVTEDAAKLAAGCSGG